MYGLVTPSPIPGMTCTFAIASSPYAAGLIQFIMSSVFDFSIFWLTLFRVYQHCQYLTRGIAGTIDIATDRMGSKRIVMIIFKDSLAYYTVLWT